MPFERDPLSVEYDAWSRRVLRQAIAAPFEWGSHRVTSPARDPVDPKGLTRHERAATRSLYYLLDYSPAGGQRIKNRQWSLQVDWGRPRYERNILGFGLGQRRRFVLVRVTPYRTGRAMVKDRNAYWKHPELRSRGELPGDDWEPRQGTQ